MQAPQPTPIDTWSLVRSLFSREAAHLQEIEGLKNALANADKKNWAEYNTLREQYGKLHKAYTLLYAENQRLREDLELSLHHHHCRHGTVSRIDGSRVEEVE
ncbi:uncharacterized protein BJX67DRAFT_382265 [Aspergillus lucknowensis]|uniref:Uncharacterized protein n=1 Tax=Aspergillus lucknowensis TaxID=176173 RepID=A0ABR4LNZ9_9EURO